MMILNHNWANIGLQLFESILIELNRDKNSLKDYGNSNQCTWNNGKCQITRNHEHIE
jgi:hypothetical protein